MIVLIREGSPTKMNGMFLKFEATFENFLGSSVLLARVLRFSFSSLSSPSRGDVIVLYYNVTISHLTSDRFTSLTFISNQWAGGSFLQS